MNDKGMPGDVYVAMHPLTVVDEPLNSCRYSAIPAGNVLIQICGDGVATDALIDGFIDGILYYQFIHAGGICWVSRYNRDNRLTPCLRHAT